MCITSAPAAGRVEKRRAFSRENGLTDGPLAQPTKTKSRESVSNWPSIDLSNGMVLLFENKTVPFIFNFNFLEPTLKTRVALNFC